MYRFLLVVCLSLFFPLAKGAQPPATYSGAAFGGRIVDGETGQPLEGAVVVAKWRIYRDAPSDDHLRLLHVVEAITDPGGFYRIPAWGPVVRPTGWEMEGDNDPGILVFKPGYEPGGAENGSDDPVKNLKCDEWYCEGFNPRNAKIRRSKNDGKDIALYKYGSRPEEPTGVIDPSVKRTPEMKIRERVSSFASQLEENVDDADEPHAPSDSRKRLQAIRAQRQAILIVDQELQRLYAPQRYTWQLGVTLQDQLREEQIKRGDKSPNLTPQPIIRQTPPPQMYGPPPGFVMPDNRNNQRSGQ